MAYVSNESGENEVYVEAFPGPSEKYRISNDGGTGPVWARNGRELFYASRKSFGKPTRMMLVDIAAGDKFKASVPRVLFEGPWVTTTPVRNHDITPDGKHFVMARLEDAPPNLRATKLTLVLNWFEELEKRAPRSAR